MYVVLCACAWVVIAMTAMMHASHTNVKWIFFHYNVIGGGLKWALIRISNYGDPNKLMIENPENVKQPKMTKDLCLPNLCICWRALFLILFPQ